MTDADTRVDAEPTELGAYEVVQRLATGGMGELYLARQRGPVDFKRLVVLKRLHRQLSADPNFIEMFLNEARLAAGFTHPNIVHIYELCEVDGDYVIAMEYVRGGTVMSLLRERARRRAGGLPPGPLVRIGVAICDALDYAYNEPDADGEPHRVIHRDISPSNVLVGFDGQVKLADFGVAKALAAESVTKATTVKGKFGYMSPEQVRNRPLDQRTDLFSLGTCLWEMAVGARLFKRENDLAMMYAILEDPIPGPSERVPGFPPELDAVIMKALARDREERYPDARAMAHDLRLLAREHGWDTDAEPLAQLVKEAFPAGPVLPGRGSESRPSQRSPSGRRPSLPPPPPPAPPEPMPAPAPPRDDGNIVTIAVVVFVLAMSVGFWVAVAPTL